MLDGSIAPEEAKSWELGARLDMPGRITGNIALFDIKKRNVLVSNSEGPTTIYSAAGEVRSRGLELDLTGAGLGKRGQRFALVVKDGVVDKVFVEAPGEFKVSSAEHVLESL